MCKSTDGQTNQAPGDAVAYHPELTMTILMTPDMANFSGNVHGGVILKYLDHVAYTCASRYARCYVVTAGVTDVQFRAPVHIGELVTFLASVNYTGRSSMEIGVRVESEDVASGRRTHTNSCYFTMVAVDEDGRTQPVRAFTPHTEIQRTRFTGAQRRRSRH